MALCCVLTRGGSGDAGEDGPEAGVLDVLVGPEAQPEVAAGRGKHGREGMATESTQQGRVAVFSVTDLQVVEAAVLAGLHVELVPEVQPQQVTRLGCNRKCNVD